MLIANKGIAQSKYKVTNLYHFEMLGLFVLFWYVVKHHGVLQFQYFPRNATYDPSNGTDSNVTLWDYAAMEEYLKPVKRTVSHFQRNELYSLCDT